MLHFLLLTNRNTLPIEKPNYSISFSFATMHNKSNILNRKGQNKRRIILAIRLTYIGFLFTLNKNVTKVFSKRFQDLHTILNAS